MFSIKSNKKSIFIFITIFICCYSQKLLTLVVGSNSAVSRESSLILFPTSENSDNEIRGFTAIEGGVSLEDSQTTCSFNGYFPISGNLNLNRGTLVLNKDLIFNDNFEFISAGAFSGNSLSVKFPSQLSPLSLVTQNIGTLNLITYSLAGSPIRSLDWSYNDNYIALGLESFTGAELVILSFNGSTLTVETTFEIARNLNSVRWNPLANYLAVARTTGTGVEVATFFWNGSTLTLIDTYESAGNTYALSWHPSGNHLALGRQLTTGEIVLFSVSSGNLSVATTANLSPNRTIQRDAMNWSNGNSYLVLGVNSNATADELLIYQFDGSTLTATAGNDIGETVRAVDWSQTGSFIAVGLSSGTERLRIYEHNVNNGTLVEKISARVGETLTVLSVDWSYDGNSLAIGRTGGTGTEVRLYSFNKDTGTLTLSSGLEASADIPAVKWSHNDTYILAGTSSNLLGVLTFAPYDLIFQNTKIDFNSDINIQTPITFQGSCEIDGKNNQINLNSNGKIKIDQNGQLILKNLELNGLANDNLNCMYDNANLVLQNCKLILSDNFQFNLGSIKFEKDVIISGSNNFYYSTGMRSTIASNSVLYLDTSLNFNYNPSIADRDLFYMQDKTACLYLDGCTLRSTSTGIRLTNGKLFINNQVTFNSEGTAASEAISLGNGTAANDLDVYLLSAAELNVSGRLEYENTT